MAREQEGSLARACSDVAAAMASPRTGTETGTEVVERIAARAADVLRVGSAGVVVTASDGDPELAVATDGPVADVFSAERTIGEGPSYDARRSGTPVRVPTLVDAGRRWPRWTVEARGRDVGAWLAVPSRTGPGAALLVVASARPRRWTQRDLTAAQVLADLAAACAARDAELDLERQTVRQRQQAFDRRIVIEQATGILAGELGCSLEDAFGLLRDQARRRRATVRSVADAVVRLGLRPPEMTLETTPKTTPETTPSLDRPAG